MHYKLWYIANTDLFACLQPSERTGDGEERPHDEVTPRPVRVERA